MLDLNEECVARKGEAGCRDLDDSILHVEESDVDEEDNAGEIEESQPLARWSARARKSPVRFFDRVMVAVKDPMTYEKLTRGNKKKEWKLALKEDLGAVEWNKNWIKNALPPAAIPSCVRCY